MKSIRLDHSTYVHVFIHELKPSLEEQILYYESEPGPPSYTQLAEELLDALDDHECVALLEALHEVSARRIVEHQEEFAPQQLEKEEYKGYLKYKK